jgi:predicted RNA-binding protein YlqC (UPF0109 family)
MSTVAEDLVAVVRLLVDDPAAVRVESVDEGDGEELQLFVAEPDRGQVIGRRGRSIDALRALVRRRGEGEGRRYALELLDD